MLLEVFAWAGQTMVALLFNIVDEYFLHVVTTDAYAILFVGLTALLSEGIAPVIREGRRQFSSFILARVVVESLRSVEEGSAVSIVLFLSEEIVGVVGDLLVESLVQGEAVALGEGEHLL